MARASVVSYEEVETACIAEMCESQKVSFDRIYERLGRMGSADVVRRFIGQFMRRAGLALKQQQQPESPLKQMVVSSLVTAAEGIVESLLEHAEVREHEMRKKFDQGLANEQAQRRQLEDQVSALQDEKLQLENDLEIRNAELSGALERVAALEHRLTRTETTLQERNSALMVAREELAGLASSLQATQEAHAKELARVHEQHSSDMANERDKANVELSRVREIADGERRHLMMQTDQLRQIKDQEVLHHKTENQSLTNRIQHLDGLLEKARAESAEARGTIKAIERDRAALSEQLQEAQRTIVEMRLSYAGQDKPASELGEASSPPLPPLTDDPRKGE